MKKTKNNYSRILRLMLVACMVTVMACGSDDDSDTNIIVNPDEPQREEEQGPIDTQPTVIINNNVETNVKVINRRTRIENNDYVMDWECRDVDPVVHKQYIHISVSCPTVIEHDRNRDGILDQVEVQQAVGPAVLALDSNVRSQGEDSFPTGESYEYNQSIPLPELRSRVPAGQDFVVMYYGVDASRQIPSTAESTSSGPINLNIPIACKVFNAPVISEEDTTTGTTGTTTGGTTTTGGSTTGDTTTGDTTTGGTTGDTDATTTTTTTGGQTSGGTNG